MLKIDKKEYDKIIKNIDSPIDKKRITDVHKYMYWHAKSDECINLMTENKSDKKKFFEFMHKSLLYEFEKNKYQRIPKKEFIFLLLMIKYHNSNHDCKIYMDKKGLKVEKYDRRAIE